MKKFLLMVALGLGWSVLASAQVSVNEGRFQKGDNPAWSQAAFNDSDWPVLSLEKDWNKQGYKISNGSAGTASMWSFLRP